MWNLPPIYICIGVYVAIKTGIQVIYTRKMGGLSASYPDMLCSRSRQKSDFMYQYARHLCLIEGGPSAFGIYMFSICTGISWYFLISWLFRMGSHWWHWTAKSSLSGLAVSHGGVHLPLVSTCQYMHWYFLRYFLLVDCFAWALIGHIEQWRVCSVL